MTTVLAGGISPPSWLVCLLQVLCAQLGLTAESGLRRGLEVAPYALLGLVQLRPVPPLKTQGPDSLSGFPE